MDSDVDAVCRGNIPPLRRCNDRQETVNISIYLYLFIYENVTASIMIVAISSRLQ